MPVKLTFTALLLVQNGLPAYEILALGLLVTTTLVVAVTPVQPADDVTVTVYVPALAAWALLIVGFCEVDANPFGPAHEYVPPPLDTKLIVLPTHTVAPIAHAVGIAFTTTVAVAVELHPAADVTVTVYVPALAACALLIVGFCKLEEKLLGPAHE